MRAKSVTHVEYELIKYIMETNNVKTVYDKMVTDEVTKKRFNTAAKNVAKLITNLADRRKHKLPEDHVDYEVKE